MGSAAVGADVVAEGVHIENAGFCRLECSFDDNSCRFDIKSAGLNGRSTVAIGDIFEDSVFGFVDETDIFGDTIVEAIMSGVDVFRISYIIDCDIDTASEICGLS